MPRVLHLLSQRPSLTGSGVTLDALVRHAEAAGWEQHVVAATPVDEPTPSVGDLPSQQVSFLQFETQDLPFPIPGMSDVMPYRSSRWSQMTDADLSLYRQAWRRTLEPILEAFRPDVVHAHHVWILGSMVKDIAPNLPVVSHCHATGLRQMALCPQLTPRIVSDCRRNDRFVVLHEEHARALAAKLKVDPGHIHVVGAGYRKDLFRPGTDERSSRRDLLYVGKYASAKGLPQLLDAFENILDDRPRLKLHIAGSGAGPEAESLRTRMSMMAPSVFLHGQVRHEDLAGLMRRSVICVLPSFYEGLPLVLVEALACGCRLVATALTGVVDVIAPHAGRALEIVALPRMVGPDTPEPNDLPAFTRRLTAALTRSLEAPDDVAAVADLDPFTWKAVFERVERVWRDAMNG